KEAQQPRPAPTFAGRPGSLCHSVGAAAKVLPAPEPETELETTRTAGAHARYAECPTARPCWSRAGAAGAARPSPLPCNLVAWRVRVSRYSQRSRAFRASGSPTLPGGRP